MKRVNYFQPARAPLTVYPLREHRHFRRHNSQCILRRDAWEWLNENMKHRWFSRFVETGPTLHLVFKNEDDPFAFRMRWA